MIQLYLKNISSDPFAEFLIGSKKVYKFNKDVNLDTLNKLDIEMKIDEKIFVPDEPYVLEFNILMNTKQTQNSTKNLTKPSSTITSTTTTKKQENDDVNTDDNDLLEKVSNLMNI